jgi:exopolyphosphatase/guanosine-5'-triphosphate,3'-diphosphate pyrophosphatase
VRIAAIDIGTNSIHMVIAQATAMGAFEVVDREREVVQIGRGSFAAGRLRVEAIRRAVDALQRFVQLARRHQVDRILCTATAAVREAKNGGEFLAAAREVAGVAPRVIPAEEEGRLIYLAVKAALGLEDHPALIVDIGGGSMQLVVGNRDRLIRALSAPLGALRLTETVLESDPPGRREIAALERLIRKQAREPLEKVAEHEPSRVYGSSGSIHALAQVAHWMDNGTGIEMINGYVLSLDQLDRLIKRLARMTIAERERLPGIDAKRAEIILPGALVLRHVLEEVEADGITISDFGVREGLVTDYIAFHAEEISALEQVEDLRLRSVIALLKKFNADGNHPRHVARLALALYDQMKSAHGLEPAARDLLHYAALLHDIGAVIGYDGHAEHSYYIIKHGNLRGLSAEEVEVVANVARYHSKRRPRKRDHDFRALAKPVRRLVRWLAAILRLAEGLDRSHYQLIKGVRVARRDRRLSVLLTARREARLEIWAARRRTDLLERVLGGKKEKVRVRVALEPVAETARKPEAPAAEPTRKRAKPAPETKPAAEVRPTPASQPEPTGSPVVPSAGNGSSAKARPAPSLKVVRAR